MPNDDIDLIGPVAQVLRVGYGPFGIAAPLVTVAILMTLAMRVGQASVAFTAVTRLPMVAGWDHMLPAWFSRLHATYQTPVNSIVLVGACSFAIASLSLIGVGHAEAFQLLFNASGIFYALTYVVMFAIPLFGLRSVTPRPPLWLRLASLSGPADDGALHRAVGVPDHQGRERVDVRPQDHDDDRGDEPGGDRDPALGAPAVGGGRGEGARVVEGRSPDRRRQLQVTDVVSILKAAPSSPATR